MLSFLQDAKLLKAITKIVDEWMRIRNVRLSDFHAVDRLRINFFHSKGMLVYFGFILWVFLIHF